MLNTDTSADARAALPSALVTRPCFLLTHRTELAVLSGPPGRCCRPRAGGWAADSQTAHSGPGDGSFFPDCRND